MKYYAYITINQIDNTKCYVGMTKRPIMSGYKGSGSYFRYALKKYGNENFVRVDLGTFNDKDECHYWEGFYVRTLKTHISEGGYNLDFYGGTDPGLKGGPPKGRIPWNKGLDKRDMRVAKSTANFKGKGNTKGHIPWNKGLSKEIDERIKKLSDKRIGQKHTIETRQEISKSMLSKKYILN
jgi:hypothetical protein